MVLKYVVNSCRFPYIVHPLCKTQKFNSKTFFYFFQTLQLHYKCTSTKLLVDKSRECSFKSVRLQICHSFWNST